MSKIAKTNAARILDRLGVPYTLVPYEVDENDLGAEHVAAQLGEPLEQVYKTLVLHGDRTGHFVCVVPAAAVVNLKKAAQASGNKKCDLIPLRELLPLTGYVRGGCSPIGMKKQFATYIDSSCLNFSQIFVSAGVRGLQFRLSPTNLAEVAKAELVDII